MKAGYPAPIVLALILAGVSCSRTGDLSGDVFVVHRGRPLRGAGTEIRMVPATARLESELRKIVSDFEKEYADRLKAYEKEQEISAQIEKDPAAQKRIDEYVKAKLSKNPPRDRRMRDAREVEARLLGFFLELEKLPGGHAYSGGPHPVVVQMDYEARVQKLVHASEGKVVLTDVNGHYEVNGLPVGRYYLSATMGWYKWLVTVQIAPGAQRVHLSNANSGSLRFLTKNAPDS